jgi:hypothetical protein
MERFCTLGLKISHMKIEGIQLGTIPIKEKGTLGEKWRVTPLNKPKHSNLKRQQHTTGDE